MWDILKCLVNICCSILKGSGWIYLGLYFEIFCVNICKVFNGIWLLGWEILGEDFVVLRVIVFVGIFGLCVCVVGFVKY